MQAFADKLAVPCAYAVPTLTLADSLATITIQDGDALDADHLLNGVVSYSGTVGYWTLDFTTGATMPQFMNLSGEMSGTVADQLYIIFDESGFGPYSGNLRADVSGTIADGSTGTFLANADGYIALLSPYNLGAFADSQAFSAVLPADSLLTLFVGMTSSDGMSGNSNFTFSLSPASVPEPGTLLMLNSGLLGFGYLSRRMRKESVKR